MVHNDNIDELVEHRVVVVIVVVVIVVVVVLVIVVVMHKRGTCRQYVSDSEWFTMSA